MADQTTTQNPDRNTQNPEVDRNRNPDTGKQGGGTERERGTVQEPGQPGTQPDRDRQGDGNPEPSRTNM